MGDSTKRFAEEILKNRDFYSEGMQLFATNYLELEAENKRLKDCLAWYADKTNYETINQQVNAPSTTWNYETTNVMEDEGERARKALERGEG